MGKSRTKAQVTSFQLEGQFVQFLGKGGKKPKLMWVNTETGQRYIRLTKLLRDSLPKLLKPGDQINVFGKQKYKPKTGELKLKAKTVELKTQRTVKDDEKNSQPSVQQTLATVMLCQRSSCRQRGAAQVHAAMDNTLRDRELKDYVIIKNTGCMKQCKKGPCMVFMPDKARYNKVAPKDVPMLVDKHFANTLKLEVSQC